MSAADEVDAHHRRDLADCRLGVGDHFLLHRMRTALARYARGGFSDSVRDRSSWHCEIRQQLVCGIDGLECSGCAVERRAGPQVWIRTQKKIECPTGARMPSGYCAWLLGCCSCPRQVGEGNLLSWVLRRMGPPVLV